MTNKLITTARNLFKILISIQIYAQDIFLLSVRLFWGYNFFLTGKGKLLNFERTVGYFSSLGIPMPEINVLMAGGTEAVGGILLFLGLGSRIITLPLMFTMIVALLTAHREELLGILNDPDAFTATPPFLFLFASLIVFLFGAGKYSLDKKMKLEE
jgi:putative oxidoreductase